MKKLIYTIFFLAGAINLLSAHGNHIHDCPGHWSIKDNVFAVAVRSLQSAETGLSSSLMAGAFVLGDYKAGKHAQIGSFEVRNLLEENVLVLKNTNLKVLTSDRICTFFWYRATVTESGDLGFEMVRGEDGYPWIRIPGPFTVENGGIEDKTDGAFSVEEINARAPYIKDIHLNGKGNVIMYLSDGDVRKIAQVAILQHNYLLKHNQCDETAVSFDVKDKIYNILLGKNEDYLQHAAYAQMVPENLNYHIHPVILD